MSTSTVRPSTLLQPRAASLRFLDPPLDARPRWTLWETGALLAYLGVVAFGIAQHVPWADEAQAWMLAQEVTLPHLLMHSLHYEGTPGLWHIFLMLLQAFHLSFTAMRWMAGAVAASGVAVLLAYAPFPRLLRLLLPFSFFLAYQDAVVARSYVLFAVLGFAAAAMLRSNRIRPLSVALILGLMAHISLHGALASGGLAVVALALWRKRIPRRMLPRALAAVVLLLTFWAAAIAVMVPASDIDYAAGNNVQRSMARLERQFGMHVEMPPLLSQRQMNNLPPSPPVVHHRRGWQSTWNKLARTLSVITYPISVSRSLALLLVALVVAQSWQRRQTRQPDAATGPIGLLPYLLLVVAFTSLYLAPRHVGMVFTSFVIAAWLTWPGRNSLTPGGRLLLSRTCTAVFVVVLLVQMSWTYRALSKEHSEPYSPDRQTALYLKQQGLDRGGKTAAGFYYYSTGLLLYFDRNVYLNQPPHRYRWWSTQMRSYETVQATLARHPDFIVIGGFETGPDAEITRDWLPAAPPLPGIQLGDTFFVADYYRHNGYHTARVFCGNSWMRSTYAERICDTVLEPDTRP